MNFNKFGFPTDAPYFWDLIKRCADPASAAMKAKDILREQYDYIYYPEDEEDYAEPFDKYNYCQSKCCKGTNKGICPSQLGL